MRTAEEHMRAALRHDPGDEVALRLLTSIKARKNPKLGLWWRFSALLGEAGGRRSLVLLLGMRVAVRVAAILADAYDRPELATLVRCVWLAFCAYTWSSEVFRRTLERELRKVELRQDC